jgi:hypothetical protein
MYKDLEQSDAISKKQSSTKEWKINNIYSAPLLCKYTS